MLPTPELHTESTACSWFSWTLRICGVVYDFFSIAFSSSFAQWSTGHSAWNPIFSARL